jgi:hypothetical protein
MSEGEKPDSRMADRREENVLAFPPARMPAASLPAATTSHSPQVTFSRLELGAILNIYGRMVAAGEWRDYALDFSRDSAVFSIYRRASEMPLYRVVKTPALARRQGAYAVIASAGQVLKRGQDLARVLGVFDKPVRLVT